MPRLEAEDALALSHFQGKERICSRLAAGAEAGRPTTSPGRRRGMPDLIVSAAHDDLLVSCILLAHAEAAIPGDEPPGSRWLGRPRPQT